MGATCRHLRTVTQDFIAARGLKPHPLATFVSIARRVSREESFAQQQLVRRRILDEEGPQLEEASILMFSSPAEVFHPMYLRQHPEFDNTALDTNMSIRAYYEGRRMGDASEFQIEFPSTCMPSYYHTLHLSPVMPLEQKALHDAMYANSDSSDNRMYRQTVLPFATSWIVEYTSFYQFKDFTVCPAFSYHPSTSSVFASTPALLTEVSAFLRYLGEQFPPGTFGSLFCVPHDGHICPDLELWWDCDCRLFGGDQREPYQKDVAKHLIEQGVVAEM